MAHLGLDFRADSFCWEPSIVTYKHRNTHLYVHTDAQICTMILSQVATGEGGRNPLAPPHPPGLVDPQSTLVRIGSFFCWPKSRPSSCQVYFWHRQIIASLLTSAIIGLCPHALQFKLAYKETSDMRWLLSTTLRSSYFTLCLDSTWCKFIKSFFFFFFKFCCRLYCPSNDTEIKLTEVSFNEATIWITDLYLI